MLPQLRRRRFAELVFFLFAAATLLWLLRRIGWTHIGDALAGIGLVGAIVIAALGFAENCLDALALRLAIGRHIAFSRMLATNSAGAVVNMLLPWELGEVLKGTLMRGTPNGVSGVIIWNYLFKLSRPIVSLSAVLLGVALGAGVDGDIAGVVVVANAAAFLPYVVLKLLVRQGFARFVVGVLAAARLVKRKDEILTRAANIEHEVRRFEHDHPRAFAGLVAAQAGARVASWLSLFAITRALGLDFSFGRVAFIYAAFNVSEFVTTLLPARIGVSEGAAFGLFKLFGFPPDAAVIIYIVTRLKVLASNGVLAPFALVKRS